MPPRTDATRAVRGPGAVRPRSRTDAVGPRPPGCLPRTAHAAKQGKPYPRERSCEVVRGGARFGAWERRPVTIPPLTVTRRRRSWCRLVRTGNSVLLPPAMCGACCSCRAGPARCVRCALSALLAHGASFAGAGSWIGRESDDSSPHGPHDRFDRRFYVDLLAYGPQFTAQSTVAHSHPACDLRHGAALRDKLKDSQVIVFQSEVGGSEDTSWIHQYQPHGRPAVRRRIPRCSTARNSKLVRGAAAGRAAFSGSRRTWSGKYGFSVYASANSCPRFARGPEW